MPIKITTIDLITEKNMKATVSYYNTYLKMTGNETTPEIELIEYMNGTKTNYGFRIKTNNPNYTYAVNEYNIMRWENKTLSAIFNYPPFLPEEELLLYKIMRFVVGKDNVIYYSSYQQSIVNSPRFNRSLIVSPLVPKTTSQINTPISNNLLWRQLRMRIGI